MSHMKNHISALTDPFLVLMILKKKKKKTGLVWRLGAKVFTFNSTNVIKYTICILFVSQNIILFLYLNF